MPCCLCFYSGVHMHVWVSVCVYMTANMRWSVKITSTSFSCHNHHHLPKQEICACSALLFHFSVLPPHGLFPFLLFLTINVSYGTCVALHSWFYSSCVLVWAAWIHILQKKREKNIYLCRVHVIFFFLVLLISR